MSACVAVLTSEGWVRQDILPIGIEAETHAAIPDNLTLHLTGNVAIEGPEMEVYKLLVECAERVGLVVKYTRPVAHIPPF